MTRERNPRPVTPSYLERAALHYLERYTSSAENLARVLTRKARRRLDGDEPDPGLGAAIDEVVARIVRSGLVDDRSFAETKVNSLMRRGTSTRTMRARLRVKGVSDDLVGEVLAAREPDDLALARRFAQRRRLGRHRPHPDPERRERDLAALCRAGFAYRIAVRVLDESGQDPVRDAD